MPSLYNRIHGHNLEQLAALTASIFAVGMTLQVLDLHVPAAEAIHNPQQLHGALKSVEPHFVTYLMILLTLAIAPRLPGRKLLEKREAARR